ncbi:TonB-dependent receptor [Massilia sp. DJPM01]|uniref:TonB-dependent receptor plug domain-containing protein n=1 Tax=Massilia sp. DJPM01 TaxID=3024404 RepID=UPI00259EE31C|nr:TonB-dependent receptor [Massilia sp. DJPM01]MDM5177245.1 TonB-dependent receptor [Massilia sp. DJPM01]
MTITHLKLTPLAAAAITLLCGAVQQAQAQTASAAEAVTPTSSVVITGSRIARAKVEGPSAVVVISGEEMTKQGYKNLFDALNNQAQNSGFTTGADFGNTHTPSANTISLRGLGPNHTLILLNGRRLADFPTAYEGEVNFTNLANIPSSIVERVEILSGGASAVYGSDAIAGVVNIILKKKADGIDVNLKGGTSSRGGGGDRRLQISGGRSFDKLNTVFSLEVLDREPLWSNQRDFMAVRDGTPTNTLSRKNVNTGKYVDLGDACDTLGDLFGGSEFKYTAKKGTYCASNKVSPTYWTTQTKNRSTNLFGSANYALTPSTELFAEFLLGQNKTANNTRGPSWTSSSTGNGYFFNKNSGVYEAWTKYISPEEMGGVQRYNRTWDDQASSVSLGAKGDIPGTGWRYEAGYSASFYKSEGHVQRALANIDSFFLGPKLGTDTDGIAIYAPNQARLTQRLTPEQFNSITGQADSDDTSRNQTLSLVATGELFTLPAGPVKLASIAEAGHQRFVNKPDQRYGEGAFNIVSSSDITAGSRRRYALGVEASVPLLKELNSTLAGRYDRYNFAGRNEGKLTYNAGVEWRPLKPLLVRGNYATSFRAPDMNYIFKARSTGYYSSTTDYYRCAQAGQSIDTCEFANVSPGNDYIQTGSKELRSEKGKSYGLGAVWSPSADFDVSIDYWNIKIDDLLTNLDADVLLRKESDCRIAGDLSSPTCVDAINRIQRYALTALNKPGEIREIRVNPINAAYQDADGIDLSARYVLRSADWGKFTFKGNYSKSFSKNSRQFAGDVLKDELDDLSNQDWRDKLNASLNWNVGNWSNTVFAQRYGKVPNAAQTAFLSPTTLVNLSSVYKVSGRATVSVAVNNVGNRIKRDTTGGWPNYPVGNYSPVGRQFWLELNYHFGS